MDDVECQWCETQCSYCESDALQVAKRYLEMIKERRSKTLGDGANGDAHVEEEED